MMFIIDVLEVIADLGTLRPTTAGLAVCCGCCGAARGNVAVDQDVARATIRRMALHTRVRGCNRADDTTGTAATI
jgi:hypothetical protein